MMRIHRVAAHLGILASAGLFAACGGDQSQPASESPPQPAADAGAPAPAADAPAVGNLPAGVTAEMVAQGQQIFHGQGICFTCHGQNGIGTPLAPNLTDQEWVNLAGGPDLYEQIVQNVITGVPQPKEHPAPMPPMGGAQLTDEQVRAVAAYVYSLSNS